MSRLRAEARVKQRARSRKRTARAEPPKRQPAAPARVPRPTTQRKPREPLRLPTLFGVDPVAPSVTEALNAVRMQITAGVALGKTFRTASTVCKPHRARHAFERAAKQIDQGASFDDTLQILSIALSYPERAILSAGWTAGKIEPALRAVVSRRDLMFQIRREIRSKMVLPVMIFVAACFIAQVPGFFFGMTLNQFLFAALRPIAIGGGIFFAIRMFQRHSARQFSGREMDAPPPPPTPIDLLVLRLPVVALVQKWRNRGEFASTMADLLGAGLTTLHALDVCARALPNGVYRNHALWCRRKVADEGVAIAEALPPGDLWPPEWLASLDVAHESGEEEQVLRRLGDHARDQYTRAIRSAGQLASWMIYLGVCAFIVFQIFSMMSKAMSDVNEILGM